MTLPNTRKEALEQLECFAPQTARQYALERNYDRGPSSRENVSLLSAAIQRRLISEKKCFKQFLIFTPWKLQRSFPKKSSGEVTGSRGSNSVQTFGMNINKLLRRKNGGIFLDMLKHSPEKPALNVLITGEKNFKKRVIYTITQECGLLRFGFSL